MSEIEGRNSVREIGDRVSVREIGVRGSVRDSVRERTNDSVRDRQRFLSQIED